MWPARAGGNAVANDYLAHTDATRMRLLSDQCKTTCTATNGFLIGREEFTSPAKLQQTIRDLLD